MATFPENKPVEFPPDAIEEVGIGETIVECRQMTEKGYDFVRGAGAAWTGTLQGSVAGRQWTTITTLAASGQGAIADQYNLVKLVTTVDGDLGTGTDLIISGKVQ